jgi:hypothetical protein
MLTNYFCDPGSLNRIQFAPAAPYLSVFATVLTKAGYRPITIRRYLRAAAHVSYWQHGRGAAVNRSRQVKHWRVQTALTHVSMRPFSTCE